MTAKKEAKPAEPFQRDTSLNVYQRLALVMEEVSYLKKDTKIQGYTAMSHDGVTAATRPALLRHGVLALPHAYRHETLDNKPTRNGEMAHVRLEAVVRFINIDNPADYVDVPSLADGQDQNDKASGKAISMAIKYALLKGLMLETGDREEERIEVEPVDHANDEQRIAPENPADAGDWFEPTPEIAENPLYIPVHPKVDPKGVAKLYNGQRIPNWRSWAQDYRDAMAEAARSPEPLTTLEELFHANSNTEARFAKTKAGVDGGANWLNGEKSKFRAMAAQAPNHMEAAE